MLTANVHIAFQQIGRHLEDACVDAFRLYTLQFGAPFSSHESREARVNDFTKLRPEQPTASPEGNDQYARQKSLWENDVLGAFLNIK